MDPFSDADFYPLAEEKFDFDVSLSPASSRGDEDGEDDVFVGPVTDKEKGICVAVEYLAKDSVSSGPSSVAEEQMEWSPLTGDNFDRMCSEAQKLATQLKEDHQQPHTGQTDGTAPAEREVHMAVDFVQDAGAKLDMFSKPFNRVLSPIKRETFCVRDSPVKLLPPAIQKRLLKGVSSSSSRSSVGSGVGVNSTRARLSTSSGSRSSVGSGVGVNSARARLSTSSVSSPASGSSKTRTQPKMMLRSKAGLGTSGILPSKRVVPATSSATSLKTANTAAVPAEKPSRMAPPSKAGLRSKAPHLQTRGVVDGRRNTSSSSCSSVSSLNSSLSSYNCSMSVSPPVGKGNLNTSLNRSKNVSSSRAPPTNTSRPPAAINTSAAKTAQTRRSSITSSRAAESKPSATAATVKGARRSISVQSRKPSETTDPTKLASRSTPLKRAAPCTPTPFQPSPAKRALVSSVSSLPQFGPRARPVALIAPTPTSRLKGPKPSEVVHSPDSLKIMKPKRLMSSAGSMDSPTPEVFHTPSMSRIRRPSALPTPVNRRMSGIPCMTPKSLAGFCRPSPAIAISARKTSNQSPPRVESAATEEELVVSPKIQPFALEDADPAALQLETQNEAPTCVTVQGPEVVEHPDENQEPEPSANLRKRPSTEDGISGDHEAKTQEGVEILLVDVPASKPEGKPDKHLIDLSNTPDLIRPLRPVPLLNVGREKELIDLSSPLIKWSPEGQKEKAVKEAPLVNLSF